MQLVENAGDFIISECHLDVQDVYGYTVPKRHAAFETRCWKYQMVKIN